MEKVNIRKIEWSSDGIGLKLDNITRYLSNTENCLAAVKYWMFIRFFVMINGFFVLGAFFKIICSCHEKSNDHLPSINFKQMSYFTRWNSMVIKKMDKSFVVKLFSIFLLSFFLIHIDPISFINQLLHGNMSNRRDSWE